ncbi:hypothetical protein KI387_020185, partial [Taxus chinensis]
MAHEGFGAYVKGVEPEHQELPYLGKHERELSSASHRNVSAEMTWVIGVHLNLPGNLALAL